MEHLTPKANSLNSRMELDSQKWIPAKGFPLPLPSPLEAQDLLEITQNQLRWVGLQAKTARDTLNSLLDEERELRRQEEALLKILFPLERVNRPTPRKKSTPPTELSKTLKSLLSLSPEEFAALRKETALSREKEEKEKKR